MIRYELFLCENGMFQSMFLVVCFCVKVIPHWSFITKGLILAVWRWLTFYQTAALVSRVNSQPIPKFSLVLVVSIVSNI